MIVAESIGFAATHSISEILAELPGYEVSHGSQHFELKCPIGQGSQTPEDFVASMIAARDGGATPVAIHTLLPPQALKPACDANGVEYWLLVRDPLAQIESCHAWIAKSVLGGHPGHFAQVINQSVNDLARMKIATTLPNCLYAFAVNHVLSFNFLAIGLGASARKMETLMSEETAFREAFGLPDDIPLPHFAGDRVHSASHRAKAELEGLGAPEKEAILDRYALDLGGRPYTLGDMKMLLGY